MLATSYSTVKVPALTTLPAAVVTVIGPEVADAGTVKRIKSADFAWGP